MRAQLGHATSAGIDPAILKEAAQWLTRFQSNTVDDGAHAEWLRWKGSSAEHTRAWEKAERLLGVLRTVPPELARSLDRPPRLDRRRVVKAALAVAFVGPAGWLGWRAFEQQTGGLMVTSVGETRSLLLQPGMSLALNTDTELKLERSGEHRVLRLVRGELLLDTREASLSQNDAITVASADGWLRLRRARLNLRRLDGVSQASVIEGQAQLQLAGQVSGLPLHAGQQADFAQGRMLRVGLATSASASGSWADGVLYADDMRLADFLDELARYRHGYVVCDPAVANLRISGVFQIKDTTRILSALQNTLPVQVSLRTPWWVSVGPAART